MSTIASFPPSAGDPAPARQGPSPLRVLRTLIARLIAADGPRLEHDFANDLIADTHAGLDLCHAASTRTEGLVERLQRHWREAMADGQITPAERRLLARDQRALAHSAHTTTEQINHLRA